MKRIFLLLFLFAATTSFSQKHEGLALTPPMGWNSWNTFACNVSEVLIKEMADAMVEKGLKDAGYEYIVIDDCWQIGRDSAGFIIVDPDRFPKGMKHVADYVHSKGLKFGIYSCAGTQTCAGRPGSRGHEYQDAYTYAKWGVDYLKYDWCSNDGQNSIESYRLMSQKLKEAGRPIVFSLCEWGDTKPWEWAKDIGHLWRTTGDISACFDCIVEHGTWKSWGTMQILDMQDGLREYAGPGHWNDPDMLEVGVGNLTNNENRAHFTMWCMLASPLIAGNDLRSMTNEVKDVLTNANIIAINQDPLGIQGLRYKVENGLETWFKPLKNGEWAVCFLNRNTEAVKLEFDWAKNIVVDDFAKLTFDTNNKVFKMKNIWTNKEAGNTKKALKAEIPARDVLMLRLSPDKK
ncbi:MAG TPA: glycoside hydrolase family 27 protein [Prolixibacteraceae bacterium]|nr:glycoside hydrolase family 27 protein [Prolixibacteraceae bacterium]